MACATSSSGPLRAAVASLLLLGGGATARAASWSIGPAPAWAAPIEVPVDLQTRPDDISSGRYDLVFDHQIRVSGATTDEYLRRVVQVLSTSGVQNASEITLDFDPSFERLVLHHVRILRGGRDVSSFRPSDVDVIRPERESEDGIYSGTLSAVIFLRDVRPGDVLDYAYTLLGAAPSSPRSFGETLQMAYGVPIGRLRHRLLWPSRHELNRKDHGPVDPPRIEERGGLTIYTWARDAVPAVLEEGDLPDWFDPYPTVELSGFDSWAEVARWTATLYDAVDPGTPDLDALAAPWARRGSLEERALLAVRFVQDEVRYLGLEIGPGAWKPRPPAAVLAQRYGDCKDKSLLLAVLLRRMGLDARPALVSTHGGRGLDARLPSPQAFDHVIVRLAVGATTRWIDPTTAHQGGRLREIAPPRFERALVVDPSSTGLESIPPPAQQGPTTSIEEEYTAPVDAPGRLALRALYSGADADDIRATLADTSAADLASSFLNHYASAWHDIQPEGALTVNDRRDENEVEILGSYRIPDFWSAEPRGLEAWSLSDVVERPSTVRRSMPLAVAHPTWLRHRLSVRLPSEPDDRPEDAATQDAAFRFARRSSLEGSTLTTRFDYESLADAVGPAGLAPHLANLDRARAALRISLSRPTGRGATRRRLVLAATAGLPALLAGWLLARGKRRHKSS